MIDESERPRALPFGFAPMLLVSFIFGLEITFGNGSYSDAALAYSLIAFGVIVFCLVESGRTHDTNGRATKLVFLLIWLGLVAITFFAWNDEVPIIYPMRPWARGRHAQLGILLLLATYVPFLSGRLREPRWLRLSRFAGFAAMVTIAGVDVLQASPYPRIDVWTVQQAGADALLHHKNPYTAVAERDTGPRVAEDVPYVYPPTQIYLTLPAYALGKDVRFTMVAALVLAGIGMRFIAGGAKPSYPAIAEDAPSLYMWLMTKLFFIVEQSWVDPVQIMLLTTTYVAYVARFPALITAALLGVVLSAKQTMFWAVGLTGVILRFDKKQWLTTGAVGAAMVAPFVWLDFRALKHANFDFVSHLPSRSDALTFNSWYLRKFGTELPGVIGFLLAGIVCGYSMWRFRGSVGRLGLGRLGIALASTYAFFFAFNKWAFANYYFTMASLAALAAAMALHRTSPLN
jgi:hypothetical protein